MNANKQADLLIVTLPPWGIDTPPLAQACLSSSLKHHGIAVDVFDFNIRLYNIVPKKYRYLWEMNYSHLWRQQDSFNQTKEVIRPYFTPLVQYIINHPAKYIGFSLPTNCPDHLLAVIVKEMRKEAPEKKIILGGVSISIKAQRDHLLARLQKNVDYCVIGQGEEVLCELMKLLLSKQEKRVKDLKGILTKQDWYKQAEVQACKNLDALPFPDFDNVNLSDYKTPKSLVMEFSRGCIGRCPFCDFRSVSPSYRTKSASYIIQQIQYYQKKYNINHLSVCDAAVNSNVRELEKVCDLLIEEHVSIKISALAIPRKEMNEKLLKKMKKAGFYRLEYGVETGSDKILKKMRKIFTVKEAQDVIRMTYKVGIKTIIYLLVGFPGEEQRDFNATKEFLQQNANSISLIRSINPLFLMAGSELFECSERYGIQIPQKNPDSDWSIPREKNDRKFREQRVFELKKTAKEAGIRFTEEADCVEFTMKALKNSDSKFTMNALKRFAGKFKKQKHR